MNIKRDLVMSSSFKMKLPWLLLFVSNLLLCSSCASAPLPSHLFNLSETASSKQQTYLVPMYVGHGSLTVLKHGCSVSLFDAGGSEPSGFENLKSFLLNNNKLSHGEFHVDNLFVSHAHRDHYRYIEQLAQDKEGFKVRRIIGNRSVENISKRLDFSSRLKTNEEIYYGVNISNYSPQRLVIADKFNCSKNTLDVELLWGTLDSKQADNDRVYARHRENNNSLVIGITGEGILPVLMLGDANIPAQKLLLRYAKKYLTKYKNGILIAAHHGIFNGYYKELYRFIRPQYIVVSRDQASTMRATIIDSMSSDMVPSRHSVSIVSKCGRRSRVKHSKDNCRSTVNSRLVILSPHAANIFKLD